MLAQKALLANLRISQWGNRKTDKRATGTVESAYATQGKVGNYTKKLLPGAKAFEEIQRISGALRAFFYQETLPWLSDGSRILKSSNYLDFTAAYRTKKSEFEAACEAFFLEYPALREAARGQLGDLFSDEDYPSVSYLRAAFACEIHFMPLPDVSDFRTEILESEKEAFLSKIREVESNALKDCWVRLHEVVSKAAVTLQNPDAGFKRSLIENVADICALLPRLNVSDDPTLETMRQAVEKTIAGISVESVRESKDARNDAARALAEIESKMSGYMGSN